MMTAIYKAMEALYERVTGERLLLTVPINNGQDSMSFISLGDFLEARPVGESRS